jgi:hypothetical protein
VSGHCQKTRKHVITRCAGGNGRHGERERTMTATAVGVEAQQIADVTGGQAGGTSAGRSRDRLFFPGVVALQLTWLLAIAYGVSRLL